MTTPRIRDSAVHRSRHILHDRNHNKKKHNFELKLGSGLPRRYNCSLEDLAQSIALCTMYNASKKTRYNCSRKGSPFTPMLRLTLACAPGQGNWALVGTSRPQPQIISSFNAHSTLHSTCIRVNSWYT